MRRIVIKEGPKYHTHMRGILTSMDNEQLNYNWLVSDCEGYPNNENFKRLFNSEYLWLSGRELTDIFLEEDFQIIWGVFSAFSPDVSFQDVLKTKIPESGSNDMSTDLSDPDIMPKHPLAVVEIQAFDSSYTIIISKHDKLVDHITEFYPQYHEFSEFFKKKEKHNFLWW